jgi:Ca2+-binding EF-hand superfamily protein
MFRMAAVVFVVALSGGMPIAAMAQLGLGEISKSVQEVDRNFDVADKNRDGKLTLQEAQSGATPMIANHFDAIDVGHKGYVTKADVHAFIQRSLTSGHAAPSSSSP